MFPLPPQVLQKKAGRQDAVPTARGRGAQCDGAAQAAHQREGQAPHAEPSHKQGGCLSFLPSCLTCTWLAAHGPCPAGEQGHSQGREQLWVCAGRTRAASAASASAAPQAAVLTASAAPAQLGLLALPLLLGEPSRASAERGSDFRVCES